MLELILPSPSLRPLTNSSIAGLVLALICFGCNRQAAAPQKSADLNGYVRIQTLMAAHPGWREVEELNTALAASDFARPAVHNGVAAFPNAYPPPIRQGQGLPRRSAMDEARRIEAIRKPALNRIERLKRTSGMRMERNIVRTESDVEKTMLASLAENTQTLAKDNITEKEAIRRAAHAKIRDLGLKEIALGSELDSLSLFPGFVGPFRADAQKRLASVTAQRKQAESELSDKLRDADERHKELLASTTKRIRSAAEREINDFKLSEQKRVAGDVTRNKNEVETVLSVLAPLESPLSVKSAPVVIKPIPPIVIQPDPAVTASSVESSAKKIREQRDRLIEFIRQDVTRRLERLKAVNHWQISTSYSPFLSDKSKEVSDLLKAEWTP